LHDAEKEVALLAATSPASLNLKVLNEDGSIFMLLSGGGASVVLLDEIAATGKIESVANYGEYSGNPSRQETYLYTKQVLLLLKKSKATNKVLLIAGGVANFTDIKKTFEGIIDAMTEEIATLKNTGIGVVVRRGGPNDKEGLAHMRRFLDENSINNLVFGSETPLTQAVSQTLEFLGSQHD
jgi:ATP-citrate lyase beta-subunit